MLKTKRKPKQAKLSTLQAKADKLASIYIRMKYADHTGAITCITCGKYLPWKEAHNAHFIERGKMACRYLEVNLHPACAGCNMFNKERHKREYTLYMLDHYGRETIDTLTKLSRTVLKPSEKREIVEQAITYYTQAIKEL